MRTKSKSSEIPRKKKKKKKPTAEASVPALPVDVAKILADAAKEAADAEQGSSASFQTRGGILAFDGTALPDNKMQCVVLTSAWEQAYFDTDFNAKEMRSPVCFDISLSGRDMKPHRNSLHPQGGEESGGCDDCPMNEWESDPKGGKGKACKERRKLAILPVDALDLDDLGAMGSVALAVLNVPVTSVKNWGNYVKLLSASVKRPAYGVITEIKLVPHAGTQFKVEFTPVEPITNAEALRAVMDQIPRAAAMLTTPYSKADPLPEKKPRRKKKKRTRSKF